MYTQTEMDPYTHMRISHHIRLHTTRCKLPVCMYVCVYVCTCTDTEMHRAKFSREDEGPDEEARGMVKSGTHEGRNENSTSVCVCVCKIGSRV